MKRTSHGKERHEDELRPTSEAFKDKSEANEIYFDIETGFYVFVRRARSDTYFYCGKFPSHEFSDNTKESP